MTDSAELVLDRCDILARISSRPDGIERLFLTPEHQRCNEQVSTWMHDAGLVSWTDACANVWGHWAASEAGAPTLIVGSHLDTVPNAGRYDGILGVLLPLAAIARLSARGVRLPYHVDVVGFGDEEGVRFGATLLGSRAVAGTWDDQWLVLTDRSGTTLAGALRHFGLDPANVGSASRRHDRLLGFFEVHIEQGPVLEHEGLPLGVVTAISGARRFLVDVEGRSGHAGTVPMDRRQDALAAAAETIGLVERLAVIHGVVATVGQVECQPGAMNVIPGRARFSVDVRAPNDADRDRAVVALREQAAGLAEKRRVTMSWREVHNASAVPCAEWWMDALDDVLRAQHLTPRRLPSGAGHDAMAMAHTTDVGMLFVRCAGGVSHHPDESVTAADVDSAVAAFEALLERVALRVA